jgi:hypothetical protein
LFEIPFDCYTTMIAFLIGIELGDAIDQQLRPALNPAPAFTPRQVARPVQQSFGMVEIAVVEHHLGRIKGQQGACPGR